MSATPPSVSPERPKALARRKNSRQSSLSISGSPLSRAGILQPRSYSSSQADDIAEQGRGAVHTQSTIRLDTMQLTDFLNTTGQETHIPPPPMTIGMTPTVGPSYLSMMLQGQNQMELRMPSMPPRQIPREDSADTITNANTLPSSSSEDSDEEPSTPIPPKKTPTIRFAAASYTLDESTPLLDPSPRQVSPASRPPFSKKFMGAYHTVKYTAPAIPKRTVQALPAVLLGALLNILDGVSYGMIMFPASGVFADKGSMGVSIFFVTAILAQLTYSLGGSGFAGANGSMMIEVVPFFHIIGNTIAQSIGPEESNAGRIIATTLAAFATSSLLTGLTFFILGYLRLGTIIGFFPRHILVGCIGGVGAFLIETGFAVCMRIDDDDFTIELSTLRYMMRPGNIAMWLPPLALAALLRVITHRWRHQLIFPAYFILMPMIFYIVVLAGRMNLDNLRVSGWIFDVGDSEDSHWYEFYYYLFGYSIDWNALFKTFPTQLALLFFNILHPPLNVPALAVSLNEDVDTNRELVAHGYSNLLAGVFGAVPNYLVYVNTLLFYRVGGTTRFSGFLLAAANLGLLLVGTGPIAYLPVIVVGALIFVLGIDLIKEALWDTRKRVTRMEYATIISIMVAMTIWDFVIGVLFGIVVSCFFFVIQNSQAQSIRAIHTGETAMSIVRRPSAQRAYLREVSKQTMILRLQGFLFFGTITHVETTIKKLTSPARSPTFIRFLVLDLTLVAGVDMSAAESFVRVHRLLRSKGIVLVFCGLHEGGAVSEALRSVGLVASEDGHHPGAAGVQVFEAFGDAMEWIENAYLRAWWRSREIKGEHSGASHTVTLPGKRVGGDIESIVPPGVAESASPRFSHLTEVANRTIATEFDSANSTPQPLRSPDSALLVAKEPYPTLLKVFSSSRGLALSSSPLSPTQQASRTLSPPISPASSSPAFPGSPASPMESHLIHFLPYFTRVVAQTGDVLFKAGEIADSMYVVESGVLRATYEFGQCYSTIELANWSEPPTPSNTSPPSSPGSISPLPSPSLFPSQTIQGYKMPMHHPTHPHSCCRVTEAMVAGTLAGELSFLSAQERNATVVVERPGVVWQLSADALKKAEKEHPEDALRFVREVVRAAKADYDILLSALATRQ